MKKVWDIIRKYFIYVNIGLLLTGILINAFSMTSITENNPDNAIYIGSFCIAIWYITLPYFSMENKEKLILKIGLHTFFGLALASGAIYSIQYFIGVNHTFTKSIIKTLILLCAISYYLYFFRSFLKICHMYIEKLAKFIDPAFDIQNNKAIKILEGVTAVIVALTGFIAAISSLLAIFIK